ncbi:MAG: ROK family transcriptional regulator, partial [Cellulomonadaceae bacterium]|nr:ROK family transcriptional regulator [Cellulomonadaceae bacterium]
MATNPAPGSQSSLREANRSRIIESVTRFGGLTQIELAQATGLSTATVSTIVKELVSASVLETSTTTRSGRRALHVTLARQAGLVAGLHISLRTLTVAIADMTGTIQAEQTLPLPADHRPDTTCDRAALLIIDLLDHLDASINEMTCIGIGIGAPIDPDRGIPAVSGILHGWDDIAPADIIGRRLSTPTVIENATALAALAEHHSGAARGFDDVLYVRLGATTSAGILINGSIYCGHSGSAGALGHVQINPTGPICRCGNRGCLDTEIGADAL